MWYHNKIPKLHPKTKTEKVPNITFDKASETYYVPMGKCIPCYVIVTSISITIVITVANTITLCFFGSTLYKTKNQLKRIIEKKSPKREAPEKGLVTAALRPHKKSRTKARTKEHSYRILPAKGINQDSPYLPHNFVPIIAGLYRDWSPPTTLWWLLEPTSRPWTMAGRCYPPQRKQLPQPNTLLKSESKPQAWHPLHRPQRIHSLPSSA